MTFPYKGLKPMADLWVNIDEVKIDKFEAFYLVFKWFSNQSVRLNFKVLTDNDGSLHIYTR